MRDRLKRRSRIHRQPTGKQLRLTDRDLEVFDLLYRYRFLSSRRLAQFFAPTSPKRFIERLGDLFHEGNYISRPQQQWRRMDARSLPVIYELTKRGLGTLGASRQIPSRAVSFAGTNHRTILQFDHAVQVSETISAIECSLRSRADRRLVLLDELLAKAAQRLGVSSLSAEFPVTIPPSKFAPLQKTSVKTKLVPDGLFAAVELGGNDERYRFYAVEVEHTNPLKRKSLEKSSFLKKLLAYRELFRSQAYVKALGIPNLFVIFASQDAHHLKAMIDLAQQVCSEQERKLILFFPTQESPASAAEDENRKWAHHFPV